MIKSLKIVQDDPWLEPHKEIIRARYEAVINKYNHIQKLSGSLSDFADGYLYYGLHHTSEKWIFREWAPNATEIYLIGDFNNWQENNDYKLKKLGHGNWETILDPGMLSKGQNYKLSVHWNGGHGHRIPSYAKRCIQDEQTKIFTAQVWPSDDYAWRNPNFEGTLEYPLIYEAHVGMATEEETVGNFNEFTNKILPRIKEAGYNTVQLMAIQEHPYYGSFGYHVSNFFAVSSRFGIPEDLKNLVDTAHGMGMAVIMDLVHSHSVKNTEEGLGLFDGSLNQYFHTDNRREHIAWDSLCFDYGKDQVLHFLLSNIKFWLEEYQFDGFRFDGVTSMIYLDHGLSRSFTSYNFYYDGNQDGDALIYLSLANLLIKEVKQKSISIAEEMSGLPGLAEPVEAGGVGFDYRLSMGIPDYWIKIIKERSDENWDIREIYWELTAKRTNEKTISYAESHDQALVGDKTIIFRLLDKEMYFHMNKTSQNFIIERGLALHKMIRLVTFAASGGGYLNFMGNEFGHPEWIDFPREGNNWSFKYARRQWSLVDNYDLRYYHLGLFDKEMLKLINLESFTENKYCNLICDNQGDQVLAFHRGNLLFIFNFNPEKSFSDYGIEAPPGKYKIVLNSDDQIFGGFGNVDQSLSYYSERHGGVSGKNYLKIYIPCRTCIVLKRFPTPPIYNL